MPDETRPPAPGTAADGNPAHVGSVVRVFLLDGKWFDLPLPFGWPIFMMNVLHHRGVFADRAWFPEHMIRSMFVDPVAQPFGEDTVNKLDVGGNVVPFKAP